jgi:hypothetical protein
MKPTISQEVIDEAVEADPASASAEYGAEFRTDVETYVPREVVDAAAVPGRNELPPVAGVEYLGFVDPSGGSSDSMTLAIAHLERGVATLDALREVRPPFSPDAVVGDFITLMTAYRCRKVTGYGGEFVAEQFEKRFVTYRASERTKSEIYKELLLALNSRRIELLDHPRLISQLCALETRTARGGRDSIDHVPGGHDDVINAAAGALVLAASGPAEMIISNEALEAVRRMRSREVFW